VDVWGSGGKGCVSGVVLGVDYNLGGGDGSDDDIRERFNLTPSLLLYDYSNNGIDTTGGGGTQRSSATGETTSSSQTAGIILKSESSSSKPGGRTMEKLTDTSNVFQHNNNNNNKLNTTTKLLPLPSSKQPPKRIISGALYAAASNSGTMGIGGAEIHLVKLSSHHENDNTTTTTTTNSSSENGGRVVHSDAYGRFIFHNVRLGMYIMRVEETDALPDAMYLPRELMKSKIIDLRNEDDDELSLEEGGALVFGYTPSTSSHKNEENVSKVVGSVDDDDNDVIDETGIDSQQTQGIVLEKELSHDSNNINSKNSTNTSLFECSTRPKTKGWNKLDVNKLLLNSDSDMSFNDDSTTPVMMSTLSHSNNNNNNNNKNEVERGMYRNMKRKGIVGAEAHLGDTKAMINNVMKTITMTSTPKCAVAKATAKTANIQNDWNVILSSDNANTNRLYTDSGEGEEKTVLLLSLLSGRIYKDTSNSNEGVKGVTVHLLDIANMEATKRSTQTDTAGNYSFHNIRPSTYVVCIEEKMMSLVSVKYNHMLQTPPSSSLSTQKIVTVCNGKDYLGADFEYHRLKEDVYSLLFFAENQDEVKTTIVYVFVFALFCIQISLSALMIQYHPCEWWGSWLISLPRITIPAHASRFLVSLVTAIFQADFIGLTRSIISGYRVVFPHRASIRRMDNIRFAIVYSSRFVIRAIGLLISHIAIIQNDNIFDLISIFLAIVFVYHLPTIAFKLLSSSSSSNRRGIVRIWKGKAIQTSEHKYLKIRSRTAMFMRHLEFIIILLILSAMQGGMWGSTTKFLKNHSVLLDLTCNFPPLVGDNFSYIPITKDHNMCQDVDDSTKDNLVPTSLQHMQQEHEVEVEKLKGELIIALRLAEKNHLRVLQEKTTSILAEKEREMDKLQFISEEVFRRRTEASANEIALLRDTILVKVQSLEDTVKLVIINKDKELEDLNILPEKCYGKGSLPAIKR